MAKWRTCFDCASWPALRWRFRTGEMGQEVWRFDPQIERAANYSEVANRGVSSWIDESAKSGKQIVVIAAGGHPRMGTTLGDYLVAFALP